MSFYVTLPSFSRPEFPDNTSSKFKVRLPTRLTLEESGWKVGLASITFPTNSIIKIIENEGLEDNNSLLSFIQKCRLVSGVFKIRRSNVLFKEMKNRSFYSGIDFMRTLINLLNALINAVLNAGEQILPEDVLPITFKQVGDDYEMHLGKEENENRSELLIYVHEKFA